MPPKSIISVTANAQTPLKCEQCGDVSILKIYHTTGGRNISCCTECYGYGTDDTYSPSKSSVGSSEVMSDEDTSASEKKGGPSASEYSSDSDSD
jgi:hypothetical protein